MALPLSSFMGLRLGDQQNKRPRINDVFINTSRRANSAYGLSNRIQQKTRFWNWYKQRPELNSPVSIRVNDTITDVDFYDLDGTALGRNKRKEAERDYERNFINERLKSIWFDAIVTGSGFGWIGRLDPEDPRVKEVVDGYFESYLPMIAMKEAENAVRFSVKQAIDEDLRKPRVFDVLPSSATEIVYNEVDIEGYRQYHSSGEVFFEPDEIIHFKFQAIDGKVDGYSPVESLYTEMILLYFIKENMISYIRNGGNPNKIYILEDEIANSPNHQYMTELLTSQGILENRHGNLVLTGNVKVEQLEEKMRDMEYKDLDLLITSNIAYALQIPVSRIPYLIGKAQSNGDSGGLAESGYWSMIDSDQRKIEYLMNSQYFMMKGYKMKFRRHYRIDDVREVQAFSMKADALMKTQQLFNPYGLELTPQKIATMLDLQEQDTQKIDPKRAMLQYQMPNLMNQNQLSNGELKNPDAQKRDDTKRQAAQNNPSGSDQSGL